MVMLQAASRSESRTKKATVLSGIQATGNLHVGNYIGALSLWVENQDRYNNLFCIANLHALTIPESVKPDYLLRKSREIAALMLACGIDPQRSIVFRQSDVPAHAYLAWIFDCCAPVGWLERMTQYKVKAASMESPSGGLLTYPVLQAADILIYKADYVPVGDDQRQHIELTRDIAQRFNHLYGECFPLPEILLRTSGTRIMGLDNPTIKMSKSIAATRPGHAIGLLDSPDTVRKTVMAAVTDSRREVDPEHASAGIKNLLILYEVLSGLSGSEVESRFAGKGYGDLKRSLADLINQTLQPIQEKYQEIIRNPAAIDALLAEGAARASEIADRTVAEVRQRVGI